MSLPEIIVDFGINLRALFLYMVRLYYLYVYDGFLIVYHTFFTMREIPGKI